MPNRNLQRHNLRRHNRVSRPLNLRWRIKTPTNGRADIQGLRAVAVVAVVADHAFHWPRGGFVGVDVFFVISGFLITGLLLREYERTGTISFNAFYRRRIKRILPAASLVIALTLAASYALFNSARFSSVAYDALWASLFSANWRFATVGTDYFQADDPASPLQHYWSLAVEEQFYFVWPAIMFAAFWLLARRKKASLGRLAVGGIIAVVIVLSFTFAVFETTSNPTRAYFSTFSRTWELGVGALLAVLAPALSRLPSSLRPVLAWTGFTGIIVSLFVINGNSTFPAPSAALPVLATAVVIASGTGATIRGLWPLTNRFSRYTGDISYSLYLVHFPVLIFSAYFFDISRPWVMAMVLIAIYVLAMYQYHLFEDWIRKSPWLENKSAKRGRVLFTPRYKLASLSLLGLLTCTVAIGSITWVPHQVQASQSALVPRIQAPQPGLGEVDAAGAATETPELMRLQSEIATALGATQWPELTPTMDEAIAGKQAPEDIAECGQQQALVDESICSWGSPDAENTAIMVGDSTAVGYVAAMRAALSNRSDWRVVSYATFACGFSQVPGAPDDDACAARKADAVEAIKRIEPDLVFVTNHFDGRKMPGSEDAMPKTLVIESVETLVREIADHTQEVIFLSPAPTDKNPSGCYTRMSDPSDCRGAVTAQWSETARAYDDLANRMGMTFIDSREWFCVERECPIFVGTTPVKRDFTHITPAYQEKIGPVILETLVNRGVVSP